MIIRLALWTLGFALLLGCLNADAAKLSKKTRAAVENGTATQQQKVGYVGKLAEDEVNRYALLQAWSANPEGFPIESYTSQISQDRIPALFRGTDAARMMVEGGAMSLCLQEEPCTDHLTTIAVQMNKVPRKVLVAAYKQKSQIDAELFREQIGSNLDDAVATAQQQAATSRSTPASATTSPAVTEGQVLDFILDPYTNETITRVVTANGNQRILREEDGNNVVMADLASTGEKFLVTTPDGKRFQADKVKLTYFGFLLISDNELHSYDGTDHQQLFFPEGFTAAKVQRQDVYETGVMLLERKKGAGNKFLDFSSLGRSLGVNQKLDYALLNLRTAQLAYFNVDLAGKEVQYLSNCVPKKGGLFNECADLERKESLYDKNGFINNDHYLWAIDWARTPSGLFAIVQEDSKITLTDLNSGERKVAFQRKLGINWFEVEKSADGELLLTAKLGFKKKTMPDIAGTFASLPAHN